MLIKTINSTFYEYPCTDSTECHPISINFSPGSYILEVWGASGGANTKENSALGGYSYGILTLKEEIKGFIFLGGKGVNKTSGNGHTESAFNGGGSGSKHNQHNYTGSGGGASDIRLVNDSLHNRIIVAGGGGGSGFGYTSSGYTKPSYGGVGGGTQGEDGDDANYKPSHGEGGKGGGQKSSTSDPFYLFGLGENYTNTSFNACGGGGGWFGGNAGERYAAGGGGGSGFVYTAKNTLVHLPERFFLKNANTYSGDELKIPYYGHGCAKITFISIECTCQKPKLSFNLLLPFIACFILKY